MPSIPSSFQVPDDKLRQTTLYHCLSHYLKLPLPIYSYLLRPLSIFSSFTCIYYLGHLTFQSFSVSYIAFSLDRSFHHRLHQRSALLVRSISAATYSISSTRYLITNWPRPYHIPSNSTHTTVRHHDQQRKGEHEHPLQRQEN